MIDLIFIVLAALIGAGLGWWAKGKYGAGVAAVEDAAINAAVSVADAAKKV
jgi:hypothetical protein